MYGNLLMWRMDGKDDDFPSDTSGFDAESPRAGVWNKTGLGSRLAESVVRNRAYSRLIVVNRALKSFVGSAGESLEKVC